jgi:hypothetical protein
VCAKCANEEEIVNTEKPDLTLELEAKLKTFKVLKILQIIRFYVLKNEQKKIGTHASNPGVYFCFVLFVFVNCAFKVRKLEKGQIEAEEVLEMEVCCCCFYFFNFCSNYFLCKREIRRKRMVTKMLMLMLIMTKM